ncbi:MAG: hypothetical protein QNJ17_14145 [Desulfocapsaceae bacterium]|nr:hypothetical protein [Desulfocapsaceae bacterium]
MKKSIVAVTTLLTVLIATSQAYSDDRVLAGTLMGAGGGALLGQAIGGDTESTLLGTVIGGAIGLTASSLHHGGYGSSSVHFKYNSYHPRPYHRVHKPYRYRDHYYRKHYHRPHYKHYRKHYYRDHSRHYRKSWRHDRYSYGHPGTRIVIKKVYKYDDGHKVRKNVYKERRHHRYEHHYRGHGKRFDKRKHHIRHWKRHHN